MRSRGFGATVYRISTATGRPARVLFHAPVEPRFIALNSFGRILLSGFKGKSSRITVLNGWISNGRLIQLPTAGQVRTETW